VALVSQLIVRTHGGIKMQKDVWFVFVGKSFKSQHKSLEEAKESAVQYLNNTSEITIESMVAPAPSEIYYFAGNENDWIKRQ